MNLVAVHERAVVTAEVFEDDLVGRHQDAGVLPRHPLIENLYVRARRSPEDDADVEYVDRVRMCASDPAQNPIHPAEHP